MPPASAQKRKSTISDPCSNTRSAKRVKLLEARKILAERPDKALNVNGELNVAAFVKAREFEIQAMGKNMSESKKVLSTRAFQQVPKDMRRRTASHNVKRVPKRLRARAAREVRSINQSLVLQSYSVVILRGNRLGADRYWTRKDEG